MKTILWFSNFIQSKGKNNGSGSWLFSMSQLLTSTGQIHLINITTTYDKRVKEIECHSINDYFTEYLLPYWPPRDKKGIPAQENCQKIKDLCIRIAPDIIHVWGVENYYCHLVPTFNLNIPTLLEIQGLRGPCADVYYGDLSISETIKCFGIREILFPIAKSIYKMKGDMKRLGFSDRNAIELYQHISTQSKWIKDLIRDINNNATVYETGISIREEFWTTNKWNYNNCNKDFYCSSGGPAPYKSIQTAIRALASVVKRYPATRLYVIGDFKDSNWLHQSGYLSFIKKMIKKMKLTENVIFTGPLYANEITNIMHKCIGMVQTSYVESYSLAVAEAMAVGVPTIISYAGAMPELATDHVSALFYSPGDYIACASRMIELIENKDMAENISDKAYKLAHERNNDRLVLEKQLRIYKLLVTNQQ